MASPNGAHQLMGGEICRQISNYIIEHDGKLSIDFAGIIKLFTELGL